jgi:hypothetical protein
MTMAALVVAGLLVWAGAALIIDSFTGRRRPDLAERLQPYQPRSVGDEAERWLAAARPDDRPKF